LIAVEPFIIELSECNNVITSMDEI
jgi:hypothetical protein